MSSRGASEFIDGAKDALSEAVMRMGEIGAEMIMRGELTTEETVELVKGVVDALQFAVHEAEGLLKASGADREKVLREIIERFEKRHGGSGFGRPRRPFSSRQPGFRPSPTPFTRDDPYNHT